MSTNQQINNWAISFGAVTSLIAQYVGYASIVQDSVRWADFLANGILPAYALLKQVAFGWIPFRLPPHALDVLLIWSSFSLSSYFLFRLAGGVELYWRSGGTVRYVTLERDKSLFAALFNRVLTYPFFVLFVSVLVLVFSRTPPNLAVDATNRSILYCEVPVVTLPLPWFMRTQSTEAQKFLSCVQIYVRSGLTLQPKLIGVWNLWRPFLTMLLGFVCLLLVFSDALSTGLWNA